MISLNVSLLMNPRPSLSYTLKASLSSLFMVSISGSSTRKVAQSWQNSPNSISPEPSSSTFQKVFQLLVCGTESHCPHDIPEVIPGKELLLLGIKEVEADFEAFDLVDGEPSLLIDLVKVNVSVRIRTLSHLTSLEF